MSDDVQCPMPRAVFLERHIVRDSNSWPPPAAGIIKDLGAAVSAVTNMDLTGHEPVLEAARHGHLLVQDRLRVEAKIPYIAPESKRTVLVPLVGNILRSIMPNIDQNLNASYARAVHPCCSDFTAVRLLPRSGVAASVLTLPICLDESTHEEPEMPVRQTEKPVEEDYLMQDAEELTSDDASTTTSDSTTYQNSSDAASASNDFYGIDPSVRVDDRHPYYHAHLLLPHRPHNAIPFPLVCIATHEEIYEVLSSALLQRRTVGINGPLLGFTFNPLACHLQMVVAWLAPRTVGSHDCFQVHVAHAPFSGWSTLLQAQSSSELDSALELGIFDISVASCASALALFLEGQQHSFILGAHTAQEECPIVRSALLRSEVAAWRLDQVEDLGIIDQPRSLHDRIYRWLNESRALPGNRPVQEGLRSSASLPRRARGTLAMSGTPPSPSNALSPPQDVQGRSRRTPSNNSLLTVPKYAQDDVELDKLMKSYEKQYPLQFRMKIIPKYSASKSAMEKDQVLDPPTSIMVERYTTGLSWPPPHTVPDGFYGADIFRTVYESIFRPVLISVRGSSTMTLSHSPLELAPASKDRFVPFEQSIRRSAKEAEYLYNLRAMDKRTVEALITFADCQVIEQALLRQVPGNCELRPLATATQDAFLASAFSVHNISAESEEKRARGLELNEAETRVSFDRLNDLLFSGHALDDEVNTDTIAEREVQHSRNDLLDVDLFNRRPKDLEMKSRRRPQSKDMRFQEEVDDSLALRADPLSKQRTELLTYDNCIKREMGSSKVSKAAHDWVTTNLSNMKRAITTETKKRTARDSLYAEATESALHLEARALLSFKCSRIDAGSVCTIPGVFPKDTYKRLAAFSIITSPASPSKSVTSPPSSSRRTQKKPASEIPPAPSADAAEDDDYGPASNESSTETNDVVPSIEIAEQLRETLLFNDIRGPESDDAPHTSIRSPPRGPTTFSDYLPLVILFLVWEFKKAGQTFSQVMNQGRFALMNNAKFLGCLGIYKVPVFGIVAVGFKAYLLMAWGEKVEGEPDTTHVRISDVNCPHWDICNRSQALHLAIFLLNLRDSWVPLILSKVREVTEDVRARWSSEDPNVRHSFDWQMAHQLGEERLRGLKELETAQLTCELPERQKILDRKDQLKQQHSEELEAQKAKTKGGKAKAGSVLSVP